MEGKQLVAFLEANGVSLYAGGRVLSPDAVLILMNSAAKLPETLKIPLDAIVAVRTTRAPVCFFDPSMADLAASMSKIGMQIAVKVKRLPEKIVPEVGAHTQSAMMYSSIPVPVKRIEQFELVAGLRRLIVARCLGWKEIDAEVVEK